MAPLPLRTYPVPKDAWYYDETAYVNRNPVARRAARTKKNSANPQFPRFQELPGELRVAIWEFALSREPRVIRPRFVETKTQPGLTPMGNLVISHIPPPPLFWVCREANVIALKAPQSPLYPDWVDFRNDIVFFSQQDYERLSYRPQRALFPAFRNFSFGPSSVYNAQEVAVEYNWEVDQNLNFPFILLMTHCRSLTRLYLVISCKYPTQRVISTVWTVATHIHLTYSHLASLTPSPAKYPTPEIVILLRRRKYEFPADTLTRSDFLSKFTVVPYKHNHVAKIGRLGVLRSVLPIKP